MVLAGATSTVGTENDLGDSDCLSNWREWGENWLEDEASRRAFDFKLRSSTDPRLISGTPFRP